MTSSGRIKSNFTQFTFITSKRTHTCPNPTSQHQKLSPKVTSLWLLWNVITTPPKPRHLSYYVTMFLSFFYLVSTSFHILHSRALAWDNCWMTSGLDGDSFFRSMKHKHSDWQRALHFSSIKGPVKRQSFDPLTSYCTQETLHRRVKEIWEPDAGIYNHIYFFL